MKWGTSGSGVQVVGQPTTVPSVALATMIIGALPPRTFIEHLVGIGIADISIENLVAQVAEQQVELRIVVVTPRSSPSVPGFSFSVPSCCPP